MSAFKIEHVGIMVTSLEVSIPFYEQVIGLKYVETVQAPSGSKLAFLSFPGYEESEVELIQGARSDWPQAGRVHHIAFSVQDIEAEYARVKALPVPPANLDAQIGHIPDVSRLFFFDGPDGERIEFFQSFRGKAGK